MSYELVTLELPFISWKTLPKLCKKPCRSLPSDGSTPLYSSRTAIKNDSPNFSRNCLRWNSATHRKRKKNENEQKSIEFLHTGFISHYIVALLIRFFSHESSTLSMIHWILLNQFLLHKNLQIFNSSSVSFKNGATVWNPPHLHWQVAFFYLISADSSF